MTFWETALASGLGALAAFASNWTIESLKRRNTNIVAGNVAMSLLRAKLTYVEIVAKHWRDEHNKKMAGPFWWQFGAIMPFPEEMRRVDVSSLGFLARSYPGLISDVIDADLTYASLMDALASYREAFTTKMWPAMHAAGVPESLTAEQALIWHNKLPRDVVLVLQEGYYALETRVRTTPGFIRDTGVALRAALDSSFKGVRFDSIEPAGKLAKANLP